jgi:hypothetical protein
LSLCQRCTAQDCNLPNKGAAEECPFFAEETGPFVRMFHVNERAMAEHYRALKEEGFYATKAEAERIRAEAEKKLKETKKNEDVNSN